MKKFKICIIVVFVLAFSAAVGYMVFGADEPKVSNYHIKAEGKEDGICCVKVSGMKNKLIQGRLNSLIQKEWMLWLKDYLEKCPSAYEESVGGYIISDRFLCLTNRLDSVVNGIGEPDYYAVYDLKTGKQVYLDDLFELNDDFIYALQQYGKTWQYDTGESMRRISGFEDDSVEEIRDYLERIVMTQTDYNKMFEGTDSESYYKSDYVISGDYLYLRVRIPLDKLEEFLKVPKWWNSKPGLENADLETVNSEIKKYLDMTNQEVRDLAGKDQDRYRDTFVFQTNVLFPCIRPENLPFYFICGDYWDDDAPRYLAFYEKAEEEYMELLGINKDMGFHDIIEVMGTEPVVWDWAEGVSDFDRERYKIELEKYGLRYVFCSDNAEGYDFSMFIEKTSQHCLSGLSADRQKQILNLIGEWELVEWSVQWRGYGYNQDWCEQDDFYIGRKVEIRPDGTAIYMDENYQMDQDDISVYGIDIALGSGYIAGDAERLGEQIILSFSSATNNGRFWIHIGEDGQVYYRDLMTGGLYSMQKVCNAGCTNGNSKEMKVDEKACFDGEMIKYLSMSVQEILDLTNAEIDPLSSSVVFEPNVLFPYIETDSFLIICRSMDTADTPIYIVLYQDNEEKYLEMLQLNSDMNFQDIMEVMGTASVEESKEWAGGYKRYMLPIVSGELEYCFCSDAQDGRRFELFIGLASKMMDVEQSKSSEVDKTEEVFPVLTHR